MIQKQSRHRPRRGGLHRRQKIKLHGSPAPVQEPTFASPTSGKYEPALIHAQALFEKLFEATPDANLLVDNQGIIVLANHQVEVSFGYRRDELIGKPVEMLVPGPEREKHIQQRQHYQAEPRLRPMGAGLELYALRKNGTHFMVDIILSPVQLAEGLFTLCVVRDISLHVANLRALQDQSALVKMVQEISAAANEANSVKSLFQFAVNRLCNFLQWPVGHAWLVENGKVLVTTHIWFEQMPSSKTSFKEASDELHFEPGMGLPGMVLETGQPIWMTQVTSRPNFFRRDAAREANLNTALAFPVVVGKETVAILEFFTDQTIEPQRGLLAVLPNIGNQLGRVLERTRAEEALRRREIQLRTLVANLPVILWVIDKEGRFTMFEGRGISGIGMQPGEIVGDLITDRLEKYPDLKAYVNTALKGQELHFEYQAPNGMAFDTYFTPYSDLNGNLAGVIGMALNISERKLMEKELDEMRHHLIESVEIERLRLSQQLHDGPLQDLYGAYYQIQEIRNLLPEESRQVLESPLEAIENVNDTLRYICGELRPSTLVHLGLKNAISAHAERIREKLPEISLHFDLADDSQSLEPGIRMGLYRVYQNLFRNVIRHSQARHAWIRLDLSDDYVTLEVQDNGKGFEVPENMIQLVRQGHFGLAATLERVEAMNGTLDLKSRPGMGTVVRAVVPRS